MSFAFVAGVSPLVGLWTTVAMGGAAALAGGRGGVMTGAAGSCAVLMVELVRSHGEEYLAAAVLLAGLMQVAVGQLKGGRFIRLVPHPVMLGFVNGLACVIFRAQVKRARARGADAAPTLSRRSARARYRRAGTRAHPPPSPPRALSSRTSEIPRRARCCAARAG